MENQTTLPAFIKEFTGQIESHQAIEVLDNLFLEWVVSESADNTDSKYRSKVVFAYRALKKLLEEIGGRSNNFQEN